MARINPVKDAETSQSIRLAFEDHVKKYGGRITNMKATLGHSLPAFQVYMEWYMLYEETKKILGNRLAYLYAWSISLASNCPLCSTFFRKIIIDAGESPEDLELNQQEETILEFGSAIAREKGNIDDSVYEKVATLYSKRDIVLLIAFAGQMIATNIFSNVIQTDIDEYLADYLAPLKV